MRRSSFADMQCSVAQTLEVIGEWWTLLIIRDALLGVTRFDEFQQRLGIARNILSNRLDTLVAHGILERSTYDEQRGRADYVLTKKGRALWPVITAIREWGDEWILGAGHEPVVMVHESCGKQCHTRLVCDQCGERLYGRDLRVVDGPGAPVPSLVP